MRLPGPEPAIRERPACRNRRAPDATHAQRAWSLAGGRGWVHDVSPTDDNRVQTERMAAQGIYGRVSTEMGDIIVADVSDTRVAELLAA
jgi:hypothetical protein